METADKIKQAEYEGNIYFCPNCKKKQPNLIVCLICHEAIDFIDNM